MRKKASDHNWQSTSMLRERCSVWGEIVGAGRTFYVKSFTTGYCELWLRNPDGSCRQLLTQREVDLIRAVVEWEIAKAEGALRRAA
jgi:hypothetical protein